MAFRTRVNRGDVQTGAQSRQELLSQFKSFSKSIDKKMPSSGEVSRAVDVFNNVFDEPAQSNVHLMNEKVMKLEMQLEAAQEVIASAKVMDSEYAKANEALERRVHELTTENRKLVALASYLRHFERENQELRFMVGDLFKPNHSVHQGC